MSVNVGRVRTLNVGLVRKFSAGRVRTLIVATHVEFRSNNGVYALGRVHFEMLTISLHTRKTF